MSRLNILLLLALFAFLATPAQSDDDSPKLLKKLLHTITGDYLKYGIPGLVKNLENEWDDFRKSFGKEYPPEEDAFRRSQFEINKKAVQEINDLYAAGKLSYVAALNEKAVLTKQEFHKLNGEEELNATQWEQYTNHSRKIARAVKVQYNKNVQVPPSINWVEKGFVTRVRDQGEDCGSCWAFASAGALEAYNKLYNGQMLELSQQNFIDCSWEFGAHGCDYGNSEAAFKWAKLHGVNLYSDYPYVANASRNCRQNFAKSFAKIDAHVDIESGDELAMKIALATHGPYTVAVYAELPGFMSYKSGIFADPFCRLKTTHAILLVGYGTDPKFGDYWLIKNSWGENWGEKGYGYIARNRNMCGIAQRARFPYHLPF